MKNCVGRAKKGLAGLKEGWSWFQLFVNALGNDSDVGSGADFKAERELFKVGLQSKGLRFSQSRLLRERPRKA